MAPSEDSPSELQTVEDSTSQQTTPETSAEPVTFTLYVKTNDGDLIKLQVNPTENIQEIKQNLYETKELCYVTSYNFHLEGNEINEFAELSEIPNLTDGSTLVMVEAPYNPLSARIHVRRLREILSSSTNNTSSVLSSLTLKQEEDELEQKDSVNESKGSTKSKKKKKRRQQRKQNQSKIIKEEEERKNELNFNFDVDGELKDFFPTIESNVIECVQYICYSGWNPPPKHRAIQGDLFYLTIKTLEGKVFNVTAHPGGFYINGTTDNHFNPLPIENSCQSHTLIGLINQISPLFTTNFALLLHQQFEQHPFEVLPINYPDENLPWLHLPGQHTYNLNRVEDFVQFRSETDALQNLGQLRDWNAEYQSAKELPKSTYHERIIRDKTLARIHTEYVNSAIQGAISIVNKSVPPLNPTDPPEAHLYIYNNIFFSHALNGRFLYEEEGGELGPLKSTNNDLRGVIAYNLADVNGLHTVMTALITYQGFRMVAQCIIPGILQQIGGNSIVYGPIDKDKTFAFNQEFHDVLVEAGKLLHIEEHEIENERGEKTKICCSMDAKGIKGTDGRKYILDLDRVTVRDVNFDQSWAITRVELTEIYLEYLKNEHDNKQKLLLAKQKKEMENLTDEQKLEMNEQLTDDVKDEEKESLPKFTPPAFNPNAFYVKNGKLSGDSESIKESEQLVTDISKFLVDTILPSMVEDLSVGSTPVDGFTLASAFHIRGVNLRYLGLAANLAKKPSFFRTLCIQEMITRTAKHIFNRLLREHQDSLASFTSHFLSCFIKGAQNIANTKNTVVPEQFSVTAESLWNQIKHGMAANYKFCLEASDIDLKAFELPSLRSLCQKTGIQILPKSYDFYSIVPFQPTDIVGFFPIVKSSSPISIEAHDLLEAGKSLLMRGQIEIARELVSEALGVFHTIYGPMHVSSAQCYSTLAMIYYHAGDLEMAILHQKKATIINERVQGIDHHEVVSCYGNLGLFSHQIGNTHQALIYINRSLYLTKLMAGPDHPDNAMTYANIGMILQDKQKHQEALDFFLKSLACNEKHLGPKHIKTATTCHAVAYAYSMIDQFRQAHQYERRSYTILSDLVGPNDVRTIESEIWYRQFTAKAVQVESEARKGNGTQKKVDPLTQKQRKNQPNIPEMLRSNDNNPQSLGSMPVADLLKYINSSDSVIGRKRSNVKKSINPNFLATLGVRKHTPPVTTPSNNNNSNINNSNNNNEDSVVVDNHTSEQQS